jgi:hypothetical protein
MNEGRPSLWAKGYCLEAPPRTAAGEGHYSHVLRQRHADRLTDLLLRIACLCVGIGLLFAGLNGSIQNSSGLGRSLQVAAARDASNLDVP